jgi:hypothetical protein
MVRKESLAKILDARPDCDPSSLMLPWLSICQRIPTPNDTRASMATEALVWEDGADCHWRAQAPSDAASPAPARKISVLQFGISLFFKNRPPPCIRRLAQQAVSEVMS